MLAVGLVLTVVIYGQVRWIGGGAMVSSPQVRLQSGTVGLKSVSDRNWLIGFSTPWSKHSNRVERGILASFRFRSPFYELDRPLSYYSLKEHIPTYSFESVQLYPFLSYSRDLSFVHRLGYAVRVGPVFSLHGGNYTTTATALTNTGRVPFVLYRLGAIRHPMAIPFFRSQFSFSFRFLVHRRFQGIVSPFFQWDIGDRSRSWFRSLPDDPWNVSEGWLRNRKGSFGFLCSVGKKD